MSELTFDADTHTYRRGDRIIPGVTSVLQHLDDSLRFVDPEILAAAAEFGNHVHTACHLHFLDILDEANLDPDIGGYLEGWKQFLHDTGFVLLHSEERVFHKTLHYAGTLDCIGIRSKDSRFTLIDIKTGTTIPKTVGPQTAAYAAARGESFSRMCVQLTPGGYRIKQLTDPSDFDYFKAALTVHRWKEKS